jgi:hypothetical protein
MEVFMKKISCFIVLIFSVYTSVYSIGLTFGPYAYEEPLLDREMIPADIYYWPLFFGGIYHKQNLAEKWFYYTDLAFTIHRSDTIDYNFNDYERKFVAVNNYFFYLHNDINWYPFNKKQTFVGTGIEAIIVARVPAESINRNQDTELTSHTTIDFFCYLDIGASIPVGPVEIGFKTLYRISPFNIKESAGIGNGELSFFAGLKR